MSLLSNLLGALAAIFGLRRDAGNRANTPEMRANAEATRDAEIKADAAETLRRRNLEEIRRRLGCIAFYFSVSVFSASAFLAGPGCATAVIPQRVDPPALPSYDATDTTDPTSGILSLDDTGAIITAEARARYNALIATHRDRWQPRLTTDYGLRPLDTTPATYHLSNAGLQRWLTMAEWSRLSTVPKS